MFELGDSNPLVVLTEDAISNAAPRFLGIDNFHVEAGEELRRGGAGESSPG